MSAAGPSQGANCSPSGGSAAAIAASVGVQHRTRVKICGITRLADALAAAREGADAIRFVFWAGTPRRITADRARAIAAALAPYVTTVGLFVDPEPEEVRAILAAVPAIPVQGLALLVGIEKFMSECRALTNVIGNGVATLVVSRWQGELDSAKLRELMSQPCEHATPPAA